MLLGDEQMRRKARRLIARVIEKQPDSGGNGVMSSLTQRKLTDMLQTRDNGGSKRELRKPEASLAPTRNNAPAVSKEKRETPEPKRHMARVPGSAERQPAQLRRSSDRRPLPV